jgi:hypothetical protein
VLFYPDLQNCALKHPAAAGVPTRVGRRQVLHRLLRGLDAARGCKSASTGVQAIMSEMQRNLPSAGWRHVPQAD